MHLDNILVPVDFSPASRNALRYALAFALRFGASLTLLHVVHPLSCIADFGYGPVKRQYPNAEDMKKAGRKLRRLANTVTSCARKPAVLLRIGNPATEIIQTAATLGVDLLIMATHGVHHPPDGPISNIAETVVREAHCPVFVVRQKEHEFIAAVKP